MRDNLQLQAQLNLIRRFNDTPVTCCDTPPTAPYIAVAAPDSYLLLSPVTQFAMTHNSEQFNLVMSAFRVGMLALETYGRRISDERPQTKYHRNPSCKEDIKWLLNLAIKLGKIPRPSPRIIWDYLRSQVKYLAPPPELYGTI